MPTYDLVMHDDRFVLYCDDKPVETLSGQWVSHENARLLRLAISEALTGAEQPLQTLSLLKKLTDVTSGRTNPLGFSVDELVGVDPLLQGKRFVHPAQGPGLLQADPRWFDYLFHHASSLASAVDGFLSARDPSDSLTAYLKKSIHDLTIEQQAVLDELVNISGHSLLINLLLVKNYLSVAEYAAGLTIYTVQNNKQPETDFVKIDQMMNQIGLTANNVLILCKSQNRLSVVEEIIHRGEDGQTEFKSTLRWDLRQQKKSPDIEHASLKSICAFLNSEGGDLLIGVRDDGSIEGIETDQFENDDRFLLHLWMLIKTTMGHEVTEWVKTTLQQFGTKTVCRVNCQRAGRPVFLNHKGAEAFYVRIGPASNSLEIRSALNYIDEHFN